jgi:hypothetical protein
MISAASGINSFRRQSGDANHHKIEPADQEMAHGRAQNLIATHCLPEGNFRLLRCAGRAETRFAGRSRNSRTAFQASDGLLDLNPKGVGSACVKDRSDFVVLHALRSVSTDAGRWEWRRLLRKTTLTWINELRPLGPAIVWTHLISLVGEKLPC